MKKSFAIVLLILLIENVFAQFPANNYASPENKYYWKNRKPNAAYWQQDVYYKITANLDVKLDIIDGTEELTYTNNSPDELPFVYFHLYSNAQAKGSYLSDLYKNNNYKLKYGKYGNQGLGTNVDKVTLNGVELKTEQDNTILKVYLPTPIRLNESITLKINFKTYFDQGTIRNRMKLFNAWGYKHFDVVHWYPRITVYDKKQGWNTDQHMDHEFYGDYGTFDVAFTLPNNYIVDATGTLLNTPEVLPADLREKLDVKNFKTKPWNEKPSVIIEPNGSTKTWFFHATNVHDFALTADPTYRIGETEWNGIKSIALVQEPHAAYWQNAAEYAARIIEVNSKNFGMYAYPKIIVADAQDGMEYPMLTLCGGFDPGYRSLFAHEVSHNWFFGMVGSNENYRAALDEGFTQFATSIVLETIEGKEKIKSPSKSAYVNRFTETETIRNGSVYNGYLREAAKNIETNINLHSDMYHGAIRHGGGYGQVYYKTATMLYNLQYVLGDSLFTAAIQNYFNQWKFAHPYFEDFRNSVIQYTHVDLNWFFDSWIETTNTINYSVKSVKKEKDNNYKITFKRNGMQMPLDFSVVGKNDSIYNYHIPNNWFIKSTSATVLPRWIGWDKVKPTYTATVNIPSGINDVIIDRSQRLADVNMLNNKMKFPVKYRFDSKIYNPSDWTQYELFARPDIWYNGYDGFKVGLHLNGNYLNYAHIFDLNFWFNTGIAQNYLSTETKKHRKDLYDDLSFRFNYKTATDKFMKNSSFSLSAKALDGLNAYVIGFDRKDNNGNNKLYLFFKSMYRKDLNDLPYLLLPKEWQSKMLNNTLNIGLEHAYVYTLGTGLINLGLRSTALMSDYNYQSINLNVVNRNRLWKFNINTRVVAQYGTGDNWARESSLFLAGANPEELMENKYTRSEGFFSPEWAEIGAARNSFQKGGGLNLRGYAGYLVPEIQSNGNTVFTYKGQTGAAINAELEFSNLVKVKKQNWLTKTMKLTTYIFGDAGIINYNAPTEKVLKMGSLHADAGLGATLTIKKFGVLQTVDPLTIRFDMPFLLNKLPATDKNYIQYRFVIGINRAF